MFFLVLKNVKGKEGGGGEGAKQTAKNQGSPTTMQATIVIAQARMTGKIVSFAKYW